MTTQGLVLINIVVAVLLDEFISSVTAEKEAMHREKLRSKELESQAVGRARRGGRGGEELNQTC